MLKLNNISKSFYIKGSKVEALKNVSIEVDDGEIVGILGTSGAGKSTLLRCINLLERPDEGEVILDGLSISNLDKNELNNVRKDIGMIFQNFNLMKQKNIYENVAFPLRYKGISKDEIDKRVKDLLKLVAIEDKSLAYPSQLSGGQKQRVAIARALVSNPKILLCDEATSALDSETTKSILGLLTDINKKLNIKIILITHQREVVKEICEKVYIMENGEVKESGKLLDILLNPQTESGENFVGDVLKDKNMRDFIKKEVSSNPNGKIYKLTYSGEETKDAYISNMSRKFDVDASILFGNIELIQGSIIGILIIQVKGSDENLEKSKKFLTENKISVKEVLL